MNEKFLIEAKVNKNDKDLKSIIEACGIEFPHESLGFFSSTYALFEKSNANGVILANSVKKQVPQLRGCQVNYLHLRKNWILGTILDSWVEGNKIKIAFSFYKSVYPELWQDAIEDYANGDLTVSFELKVNKEDIIANNDGTRTLTKVSFDGVGLLFGGTKPACEEAIVFDTATINKLLEQDLVFAKRIQNNKEISEPIIQQFEGNHWTAKYINQLPDSCFAVVEPSYLEGKISDKRARHLPYKDHEGNLNLANYRYALRKIDRLQPITDSITNDELIEKAQEVLNHVNISLQKNEEDTNVDNEANEKLLAKLKEVVAEEFGAEAVKDWTDEDYQNEEKIEALRESLKEVVAEVAPEVTPEVVAEVATEVTPEAVVEEKAEEEVVEPEVVEEVAVTEEVEAVVEPEVATEEVVADVNEVTKESRVFDVTYKDDGSMEVIETIFEEREVDGKKVKDSKSIRQTVYASEKVDAMKADYEAKIADKDAEIEKIKSSAKTIAELRAELGDYVAELEDEELLDEDKIKIARLTKQIEDLKASKEDVNASAEVKVEGKIETGHDNTKDDGTVDVKAYIRKEYNKVNKIKK